MRRRRAGLQPVDRAFLRLRAGASVVAAGLADTGRGIAARGSQARGQGIAEYAMILALIIIVAVLALIFFGGQVTTILSAASPTAAPSSAVPSVTRLLSPTGS